MRVVFLTHNYPRWPGDLSGAFLATLAAALVRRGVEVRVVAPSDEGQGGEEERRRGAWCAGSATRRPRLETIAYRGTMAAALRAPGGWRALAGLWRALRRAAQDEIAGGADLVHAHWWVPAGPRRAARRATGAHRARHRRRAAARLPPGPPAGPPGVRARAGRDRGLARAGRLGPDRDRAPHRARRTCIRCRSTASRWPWTTGGGGTIVVARLTAQKRINLAIETTAFLASCGHDLPLTIVGDGPERERLERAGRAARHRAVRPVRRRRAARRGHRLSGQRRPDAVSRPRARASASPPPRP